MSPRCRARYITFCTSQAASDTRNGESLFSSVVKRMTWPWRQATRVPRALPCPSPSRGCRALSARRQWRRRRGGRRRRRRRPPSPPPLPPASPPPLPPPAWRRRRQRPRQRQPSFWRWRGRRGQRRAPPPRPGARGLHSFASRLNLSDVYGIGVARRGCVSRMKGVLGGGYGCVGCFHVSDTAQVELKSERV